MAIDVVSEVTKDTGEESVDEKTVVDGPVASGGGGPTNVAPEVGEGVVDETESEGLETGGGTGVTVIVAMADDVGVDGRPGPGEL